MSVLVNTEMLLGIKDVIAQKTSNNNFGKLVVMMFVQELQSIYIF